MPTLGQSTSLTWNGQTVGELNSIGSPTMAAEAIDITTHESANSHREFLQGLIDAGAVALAGNFKYTDTNGQLAMLTDFQARTSRTVVITFPGSIATWSFTGFLTKWELGEASVDGAIPFSAEIKITGKPTFATVASNNLSALTITTATLYPAFAAGTYDYTGTSTGSSVTVTPTASAGVITVNGSTVSSGVASSAISLGSSGTMTTITIVVTESGKTPKTYTVRIAKTA
jgi:predicted secreted protein